MSIYNSLALVYCFKKLSTLLSWYFAKRLINFACNTKDQQLCPFISSVNGVQAFRQQVEAVKKLLCWRRVKKENKHVDKEIM